ncbi:hypothetical protein GW17_00005600 [Ensete ventricosum]|nr:hypothetical protein GW17_00005600 [Ensete ventricosum]
MRKRVGRSIENSSTTVANRRRHRLDRTVHGISGDQTLSCRPMRRLQKAAGDVGARPRNAHDPVPQARDPKVKGLPPLVTTAVLHMGPIIDHQCNVSFTCSVKDAELNPTRHRSRESCAHRKMK